MAAISKASRAGGNSNGRMMNCSVSIWLLLLTNLLVFQITYQASKSGSSIDFSSLQQTDLSQLTDLGKATAKISASGGAFNPLAVPEGSTQNLPSIRVQDKSEEKRERGIYGGEGDKSHLGGFTDIDLHGISPMVWKLLVEYFGVKSILDVGCGRGISTSWFVTHGVDALCVEGSHDAVMQSMLPDPSTQIVEHDFSRGPYWPAKTYDAVWCVEFLEHVGRNFHQNYLPVFRKAGIIFATKSNWGGWHHVEVHEDTWWIQKFELYGFKYSPELTQKVRQEAGKETSQKGTAPNGGTYNPQHLWLSIMVFLNPAVGALPQHHHLLAEDGCYDAASGVGKILHRKCGSDPHATEETALDSNWEALTLTDEMDRKWEELVKKNVQPVDDTTHIGARGVKASKI
mmetsp:Transcript_42123/g.62388  ORF Transcript_42123/g.62388 Transcript_42123/m.62388 type:complete len:400 (-) Transcript_42123:26-1225(-)|eukprot:CAMPEP_0194030146 /NCGR_PEP_ID=MMETSP0009_2-20130614/3731_1 /TAXON_ID=210454 /ORGANISM="Grammatophora oceanica, Strain CCMP 410" /LENGTH=399 /DNA_ID=CAMNT_0038670039 /DNA_START=176 /DNA_END=1375 /DNA_ORIENTATION=+